MTRTPSHRLQRGTTLIEVLVTIVIIAFGLLGMAGLQMRMQVSELEAYQRSQALMLLTDMASRISTNRANAASYVTGTTSPLGTGYDCTTITGTSEASTDLSAWCNALQGASETLGGVKQGGIIGARGCVEQAADGDYMITVAWQGMTPISAPPTSVACGVNDYNTGTSCTADSCRRTVTTVVRIATLT